MEWGVSEVRLWSFCVCGGVVGDTPCSFKWGFSCRNLGSDGAVLQVEVAARL